MSLDLQPMEARTHAVPAEELLVPALRRLQRQKQYARVLERGGNRAAGVREWFEQASACLRELAAPVILLRPVTALSERGGITLADRVYLEGRDLAEAVARGARVTAYLVTLGYSQAKAFDWLGGDYAAHHVQSDLGNEVLFELGRRAHRLQREAAPHMRLRRVAVQASDLCGQQKLWDPAKVQALLEVFGDANPGVTVTDTGCFQPLNTLLGLTLRG